MSQIRRFRGVLKADGLPIYQLTNLRTHELPSQSTICYGVRPTVKKAVAGFIPAI
jgi:hypothetical protein